MWLKSITFLFFVTSLVSLAVLHTLALTFFIYWTYPWFDIPMHILGGVVVSLGFLTFFGRYARMSIRKGLLVTLGVTFFMGVGWEVFEVWNGLLIIENRPILDTAGDLFFDILGGVIGYFVSRKSKVLDKESEHEV